MSLSRIALALAQFAPLPQDGTIAVYGPPADADLAVLPVERLRLVQGMRPLHDIWAARGYVVAPEPEGRHCAALIFMTRARAQARAWLADAAGRLAPGAPIWIDGQKTDGVETLLRDLRAREIPNASIAKSHGRIAQIAAPGPLSDWQAVDMQPAPGFVSRPGVFSADGIDAGSQALADALPAKLPPRVAELGAGWGWLAAQILSREGVRELTLIEADHAALACARRNLSDPRLRFEWADATRPAPGLTVDAVVMNPPFHASRVADPGLGAAFIAAASAMLTSGGALWMVANRHLPYEATLARHFRNVAAVAESGGFKILHAQRPIRLVTKPTSPAAA